MRTISIYVSILSITLGLLLVQIQAAPGEFSFANMYADHMVLQKSPARALIRGYATQSGLSVYLNFNGLNYEVVSEADELGYFSWTVSLEPTTPGGPYNITAEDENGSVISISDVLFGDVWFCSGQSNMVHTMIELDNPEEDIANSINYPEVRFFQGGNVFGDEPYPDATVAKSWSIADGSNVATFSAICWTFGTQLYDQVDYPIGLIQSAYGGTRIEAWSSQETLDKCFPDGPSVGEGANEATVLYNRMVYPFLSTVIYGALWYQGESNTGYPSDYGCAISNMISDWRLEWSERTKSNTNLLFPFGQVQLAPNGPDDSDIGFPDLRWAQTNYIGYTPNEALPNVFTAVAIDLPDFDSPSGAIHPRYKRQIADRLLLGALQLGYNITTEGRYLGPYPTSFVLSGNRRLEVDYDNLQVVLEYRDLENSTTFEICCSSTSECSRNNWFTANILATFIAEVVLQSPCSSNDDVAGLRYAWRVSPCVGLENCAIYSAQTATDTLALPAPPFIVDSSAWTRT